jgi:hypothetical protein
VVGEAFVSGKVARGRETARGFGASTTEHMGGQGERGRREGRGGEERKGKPGYSEVLSQ